MPNLILRWVYEWFFEIVVSIFLKRTLYYLFEKINEIRRYKDEMPI